MNPDFDVAIIGGGPAGATIGSLLAMSGHRTVLFEKDIHPRDHVGESLTPSTNPIFAKIGFLEKMEDAGFVHKPGACWTAPRSPIGKFVSIRLAEFPPPGATQFYTYNVERDAFDTMLLRHAYEKGVKVIEGSKVLNVLFEDERAVGVRVEVTDGWERDVTSRFVVDASGRRCFLPTQLKMKEKDSLFNQFCIYSWFKGVEPNPPGYEGMLFLHFLDLERCWAWSIPLRNGYTSVGVVTDKQDFQKSGRSHEAFFDSLLGMNRTLQWSMRNAERIRPWWIEADYSYQIDRLSGPGWVLVGDALRFVDPVFSTGVDVAMYSANYGFEAIDSILRGTQGEADALAHYDRTIGDGVEAWYELIAMFYKLRNLFTASAVRRRFREKVVRILQGNLYTPEALERAREMIDWMHSAYDLSTDPDNLLAPGALLGNREWTPVPQNVPAHAG